MARWCDGAAYDAEQKVFVVWWRVFLLVGCVESETLIFDAAEDVDQKIVYIEPQAFKPRFEKQGLRDPLYVALKCSFQLLCWQDQGATRKFSREEKASDTWEEYSFDSGDSSIPCLPRAWQSWPSFLAGELHDSECPQKKPFPVSGVVGAIGDENVKQSIWQIPVQINVHDENN